MLANTLESPALPKATAAAKGLARIASEEAVDALVEALREEATQEVAFIGLAEIAPNSPVAVEVLISALEDEAEIVRMGAAYGLAEVGPHAVSAIPRLAERIYRPRLAEYYERDESEIVRGMVAYALGEINPVEKTALEALSGTILLDRGDPYEPSEIVRKAAANALHATEQPERINSLFSLYGENRISWVALLFQPKSRLLSTINRNLLDSKMSEDVRLGTIDFIATLIARRGEIIRIMEASRLSSSLAEIEQEDFQDLFENIVRLIKDQTESTEIRLFAVYALAEMIKYSEPYLLVDKTVLAELVLISGNEGERTEIRYAAVYAIATLINTNRLNEREFLSQLEQENLDLFFLHFRKYSC